MGGTSQSSTSFKPLCPLEKNGVPHSWGTFLGWIWASQKTEPSEPGVELVKGRPNTHRKELTERMSTRRLPPILTFYKKPLVKTVSQHERPNKIGLLPRELITFAPAKKTVSKWGPDLCGGFKGKPPEETNFPEGSNEFEKPMFLSQTVKGFAHRGKRPFQTATSRNRTHHQAPKWTLRIS